MKPETLRDEFAMAALSGILAGKVVMRPSGMASAEDYAEAAYLIASAMLAEREKGKE